MLNLLAIANILFLAFGAASFANFFDDCLEEGEIFDFYGRWVKKEMRQNASAEKAAEQEGGIIIEKIPVPKWKKPIGGCIVCTNTWITIVFLFALALTYFFFDHLAVKILIGFVLFLSTIGISNTALKFIIK